MKLVQLSTKQRFFMGLGAAALIALCWKIYVAKQPSQFSGVLLTGVHHMGREFNVSDFYVDRYSGGNVGRERGGGSDVCCIRIPRQWRPGLYADLRWDVNRWVDTGSDSYGTPVSFQGYRASVPIERYDTAEHLYVHFFSDGRARIVSSVVSPEHPTHPVQGDSRSAQHATRAVLVAELFSEDELAETRRKSQQDRDRRWR